jgi:hypothetical protein
MAAATTPSRRSVLTFGIIGAGIAVAIVVGVLFVMPLVTAPPPSLTPEQQQRQEVLNTPNTGQPGQPIIEHQELRRDDPVFDRYMVAWEQCEAALDNRMQPDVLACRQALSDGVDRWCTISNPEYNQVKCKEASENASGFDLRLEVNNAMDRIGQ